jgi:hypothetical protein
VFWAVVGFHALSLAMSLSVQSASGHWFFSLDNFRQTTDPTTPPATPPTGGGGAQLAPPPHRHYDAHEFDCKRGADLVFGGPVREEIAFRVLLLHLVYNRCQSRRAAAAVSSVVFALFHAMNAAGGAASAGKAGGETESSFVYVGLQVGFALVVGGLYGTMVARRGAVREVVALHVLHNACAGLVPAAAFTELGSKPGHERDGLGRGTGSWVGSSPSRLFACASAAVSFAVFGGLLRRELGLLGEAATEADAAAAADADGGAAADAGGLKRTSSSTRGSTKRALQGGGAAGDGVMAGGRGHGQRGAGNSHGGSGSGGSGSGSGGSGQKAEARKDA